jgi:hypothetical protein
VEGAYLTHWQCFSAGRKTQSMLVTPNPIHLTRSLTHALLSLCAHHALQHTVGRGCLRAVPGTCPGYRSSRAAPTSLDQCQMPSTTLIRRVTQRTFKLALPGCAPHPLVHTFKYAPLSRTTQTLCTALHRRGTHRSLGPSAPLCAHNLNTSDLATPLAPLLWLCPKHFCSGLEITRFFLPTGTGTTSCLFSTFRQLSTLPTATR